MFTSVAGVADSLLGLCLALFGVAFVFCVGVSIIGLVLNVLHKLGTGGQSSGIFPPQGYDPWGAQQAQPVVYLSQPQRAALPAASFSNEPRLIGRQSINQ
jgi:hypothetical protein